jgi:hypothetical protein
MRSSADSYDVSYAYRFGPPHHDVAIATWYDEERRIVSQACHFIGNRNVQPIRGGPGDAALVRRERRGISGHHPLRSDSCTPCALPPKAICQADNYFHLASSVRISIDAVSRTWEPSAPFRGDIEALNLELTGITPPRENRLRPPPSPENRLVSATALSNLLITGGPECSLRPVARRSRRTPFYLNSAGFGFADRRGCTSPTRFRRRQRSRGRPLLADRIRTFAFLSQFATSGRQSGGARDPQSSASTGTALEIPRVPIAIRIG